MNKQNKNHHSISFKKWKDDGNDKGKQDDGTHHTKDNWDK